MNKLYIDKIDETISEEFYFEKKNEWQIELDEARMQFDFISQENDEIIQKASVLLTLCKNAYSKYLSYDRQKRRYMLNLLVSNFTYDGQKLDINIKSTVKTMLESAYSSKWWTLTYSLELANRQYVA